MTLMIDLVILSVKVETVVPNQVLPGKQKTRLSRRVFTCSGSGIRTPDTRIMIPHADLATLCDSTDYKSDKKR